MTHALYTKSYSILRFLIENQKKKLICICTFKLGAMGFHILWLNHVRIKSFWLIYSFNLKKCYSQNRELSSKMLIYYRREYEWKPCLACPPWTAQGSRACGSWGRNWSSPPGSAGKLSGSPASLEGCQKYFPSGERKPTTIKQNFQYFNINSLKAACKQGISVCKAV